MRVGCVCVLFYFFNSFGWRAVGIPLASPRGGQNAAVYGNSGWPLQHRQSKTQKEERNTRLCLFSGVENAMAPADLLFAAGKKQPPTPMFYFPPGKNGPAQSHLLFVAGPHSI